MSSATITDPSVKEQLDQGNGDEKDCIICPCKPFMSFCGRYFPDPNPDDEEWGLEDPTVCSDCRAVCKVTQACPYCGLGV